MNTPTNVDMCFDFNVVIDNQWPGITVQQWSLDYTAALTAVQAQCEAEYGARAQVRFIGIDYLARRDHGSPYNQPKSEQ